jgi:hypothetical protein
MNLVEKNIIDFIDTLIVDDYSTANKFLENIVHQKIKNLISESMYAHPFKLVSEGKKKKAKKAKTKAKSMLVGAKMEDPSDTFKKISKKTPLFFIAQM